ncbi:MAG TPA: hypothetical protein VNM38_04870 [Solirubrobacterales bacterium]|nr:hypothetical protein [Solirubrobacterales bacterium]
MQLANRSKPGSAVFVAAALAAVAFILGSGMAGTAPGSDVAAAQPDAHVSQPYLYLKTRGTYRDTAVYGGRSWSVYEPALVEQWVAADGSGRQREASDVPRFVSPADKQAWREAGKPQFLGHGFNSSVSDEFFPAGGFAHVLRAGKLLSQMPTEPEALAQWLQDRVEEPDHEGHGNGFPVSTKTIELVTELLSNPLATPAQRLALIAAERRVPGVTELGPTADEIGRQGIAIGARSANSGIDVVYSLIFDPATSEALASEQRMVAPPAGDSGLFSSTAYLTEGETRSRRARPQVR